MFGDVIFDVQSDEEEVPKLLEYSSCLIHLAVFGILGVSDF